MLTVGREAMVLRVLSTLGLQVSRWCTPVAINGTSFTVVIGIFRLRLNRAEVDRVRRLFRVTWHVDRDWSSSHNAVANMNADPFEHARPAVTLIGRLYRNVLEPANSVC